MSGPGIFQVGDKVSMTNFGEGIVRWIGTNPKFKEGDWIGVELPTPTGRNDGSVQNVRYFQCPPLHGVMVKHRRGAVLVERNGVAASRPGSQLNSRPSSTTSTGPTASAPVSRPASQAATRPAPPRERPSTTTLTSPPRAGGVARLTRANTSTSTLSIAAPPPSQPIPSGNTTPTISNSMEHNAGTDQTQRAASSPATSSPATSMNDTPTPAQRLFVPRHGRKPSAPLAPSRRGDAISIPDEQDPSHAMPQLDLQRTLSGSSAASSHRSGQSARLADLISAGHGQGMARNPSGSREGGPGAGASGDLGRHRTSSIHSTDLEGAGPSDVFGTRRTGGVRGVLGRKPSQQSLTTSEHSAIVDHPAPMRRDASALDAETRATMQQRNRESIELRSKIKILEKKRAEDAERIRALEEANTQQPAGLADLREKMSARFKELNQDLSSLRRQVKDHEAEKATFEGREAELVDQLEINTLDKEMAEEKAEALASDLTHLKDKHEELALDYEVLKEQAAVYDHPPEPGSEQPSSAAYVHLQKHYDRLKAVLAEQRDQYTDTENKLKRRVQEMERELAAGEALSGRLLETSAKLQQSEATVEDLKQQLDAALGAEEMLEQLTDRTLSMSDKIEEMRIVIEDLEALKELSDELEENHNEADKQQRADIEELEYLLQEEITKVASLQDLVADREMTIGQFRDLVGTLHEQIDDLQAAETDQQDRTTALSTQSQAVLNRNLQLQTARVKEQERMIDIELARLDARQAIDHLGILQAFVPESYNTKDAAATDALLFLTRITRKAEVVLVAFCHIYHLPEALLDVKDEKLVGVCELRANISEMASYVKRSGSVMQRTTPEEYLNLAGSVPEMRGIEVSLDRWLDTLKQDEFSETSCAADLAEIVPRVKQFVESVFIREELDVGERHLGLAVAFDCDLDSFAAAVGFARVAALNYAEEEDSVVIEGDGGLALDDAITRPVQRILDQVRGVKASSMNLRECMDNMQQQSASLKMDAFNRLRMLKSKVEDATDLAFRLAGDTRNFFEELRESGSPLRISALMKLLGSVVSEVPSSGDMGPWDLIGAFVTRLGTDIQQLLPTVKEAIESGNLDKHTGTSPWILRSHIVRAEAASNADAEVKVIKQGEEISELVKQVKLREQTLEEAQVKAEIMRRKAEEAAKQVDGLNEIRQTLERVQTQEKALRDGLQRLQVNYEVLEKENGRLRAIASSGDKSTPSRSSNLVATAHEANVSGTIDSGQAYEQIESLKSAIRYLRHENTLLKAQGLLSDMRSLPHLPQRAYTPDLRKAAPGSPTTSSDGSPMTPPPYSADTRTLRPFAERKTLWRELAHHQASAEIVDLTKVVVGKKWKSIKTLPETQLGDQEREEERIRRRARAFVESTKGAAS